jgi:hypothetical protein
MNTKDKDTTISTLVNALQATRGSLPRAENVRIKLKQVRVEKSPDGGLTYSLADLGEKQFVPTHHSTYPARVGKRGEMTGLEVIESLAQGYGSPVWNDGKSGLTDDAIYAALVEALAELDADGRDARNASDAVARALAYRKGATPPKSERLI